jgi:hypothetical protein
VVALSLGIGYLAGNSNLRTETLTSVTTATTASTALETETITSTVTGNPVTRTSTLNLTVTSAVTVAPPNYALVNSSVSNGLEVSALIGPVHVATGQNIAITIWVSNTLSRVVTVNATGITNPIVGPCPIELQGAEVYQGNYTASTLPPGGGLFFYNPTGIYSCPTTIESQFSFSPNSDIATSTSELSGYYAGSGQNYAFTQFPPGVYTVKVFDAWHQVAIGHFEVTG